MKVSGQLYAPATLPPWKEPLIPIGQEAEWAPELFCIYSLVSFHVLCLCLVLHKKGVHTTLFIYRRYIYVITVCDLEVCADTVQKLVP